MREARTDPTATLLSDGRVLITGGRAKELDSTEIYDPVKNSFSSGPTLSRARAGHTATILDDGTLLVAGGDKEGSAEIFYPSAQRFEFVDANMRAPRGYHSAGSRLDSGEILDPETRVFSAAVTIMGMARQRPTLRVLPDGKVQVIGGDEESTMEMFNPEAEKFTALAHLLNGSASISTILRAQTRGALIEPTESKGRLFEGPRAAKDEDRSSSLERHLDRSGHTLTEITQSNQALAAGGLVRISTLVPAGGDL